jgi:hypothetical protein
MYSRKSELLGTSRISDSAGRVLIVNGFDRAMPGNTNDFCIEHGIAFNQLGHDFDTATNEAVISGMVRLSDYMIVDWILGEESSTNRTFNKNEQKIMISYIENGGKIMVSGSEIGWDLVEKSTQSSDSVFFSSLFGARYAGDDAETSRFLISGQSDTLTFGVTYTVDYPDIFYALHNSDILFHYDTGKSAGIGKRHKNNGVSVVTAFPLETVAPSEERKRVFKVILEYLLDETNLKR